jgi:large subunit ribosomal protein L24
MQATKPVKKPGKQRKRMYNAPAHLRHKLMAAPLSAELISSKGAKSLPVRKGDSVRIMRGDHKGFEGKVSRVDLKRYRIFIEGLTREKVDGTNIFVSVHPSKVTIKNLKLDDKWRKEIVERKKELELPKKEKTVEKVVEKSSRNAVEAKKEKIVKEKAVIQKKTVTKTPKAAKKTVQKKPVAKKKKTEKAAEEEKPAKKEETLKAAKKPRAKRKATSETEGGP